MIAHVLPLLMLELPNSLPASPSVRVYKGPPSNNWYCPIHLHKAEHLIIIGVLGKTGLFLTLLNNFILCSGERKLFP